MERLGGTKKNFKKQIISKYPNRDRKRYGIP